MQLHGVRPEVIAALTRVPEVKKQVRAAAAIIRDEARRRAPRETGALRRSIKVDNVLESGTGQVVFRVGWDKDIAFYGSLVELSHPHLQPAAAAYSNGTIQPKRPRKPRKKRTPAEAERARLRRSDRDAAQVARLFGDEG
jgi:hypothetical protein